MSDYADAVADRWLPVDEAQPLRFPPAVREQGQGHLPAVITPTVLPAPVEGRRGVDLVSLRIAATGVGAAGIGVGVDLAGQGIREAGPYLWALAGVLVALAMVIGLIKGHAAPSGGTTVTFNGGRNKVGRIG